MQDGRSTAKIIACSCANMYILLMIISLYLLNFAQSGKVVHVLYNNVSVERCVFY